MKCTINNPDHIKKRAQSYMTGNREMAKTLNRGPAKHLNS